MQKELLRHNKKERGFQLLEAVIAGAIFLVVATALVVAYTHGSESTAVAGQRLRASYLAEEGLEAARNIRDQSFTNLTNGTFGVGTSSSQYVLTGATDTKDIFTRSVTVSTVDAVTKQVISSVIWPETPQRTGTVALTTYLGNTGLLRQQANNLVVNTSAASVGGTGNRDLLGITLRNTGASSIVITRVSVGWTNVLSSINQVVFGAPTVWSGVALTGSSLDITDTTIAPGTTLALTRLRFSANMRVPANVFTITFTLGDGSTKTVTYP